MYFNRRRISSLAYILVNLYQQFELFLCPAFPLVFFKLVDLLSFSSFHLFLAVLDLHCCMGFSLVMVNGGYSLAVVNEVLIVVASLVMEPWLQVGGLPQLPILGSRAQAQQLWHMGLVAPWHVGSSHIRDRTHVSCIGRKILYY